MFHTELVSLCLPLSSSSLSSDLLSLFQPKNIFLPCGKPCFPSFFFCTILSRARVYLLIGIALSRTQLRRKLSIKHHTRRRGFLNRFGFSGSFPFGSHDHELVFLLFRRHRQREVKSLFSQQKEKKQRKQNVPTRGA